MIIHLHSSLTFPQTVISPKLSPRLSLPEPVSQETLNEISAYETQLSALNYQLLEEEMNHKKLLIEKDVRIQELEDTMESMKQATVDPIELSRSTALEERIVEMTIVIEEKDRRIFNLQAELDQLKGQIFALRAQVDRIPELESTINSLDNTLTGIRRLSQPIEVQSADNVELSEISSGDSSLSDEDVKQAEDDTLVTELGSKITSLETTIMDLDRLVITLRTEKDVMTTERDSAMELLRMREEQFRMEMEEVMKIHANEMRVNDETITNLRDKIFTLQDKLEVAEMARISLTTDLELVRAKSAAVVSDIRPTMVSRPVSPLPQLTESTPPTIVAPTPVMVSPEMVAAVVTATPQMLSPRPVQMMQSATTEPENTDDQFEIETDGGSVVNVSERVKAIIDRQREQIEELNFELIALRLKVAEEMVSPKGGKAKILSANDSSKSTPSDQFVIPHRDLVPLSPRPVVQPPTSPPAGCTGCFPSSMFKKHNRNIILV